MNRARAIVVGLVLAALVVAATPATPTAGSTRSKAARVTGPFDGRWTATITRAQLLRAGARAPIAAKLYGPWTALFQQGRFLFRNRRTGTIASGTFTAYTDRIGQSVEAHKATFTAEVGKAGRGLGPLTIVGPLLALLACGFAVAGIRARLEEYR